MIINNNMKNLNFSKIFYSKGYVIGKIENINHFQKIEKEISKITLKFLEKIIILSWKLVQKL